MITVFIHGWGMHSGMWSDLPVPHLCLDLPGHAQGVALPETISNSPYPHLDAWVDALASQIDQPIQLCGWSLGGQVALRWAQRYPNQVKKIILVASTPCFVRQTDWDCAMPLANLQAFADALLQDYASTLRRFLAIQLRGSEQERELLAQLRQKLLSRGEPQLAALQLGLDILRDTDLRTELHHIQQPTLIIAGQRDTLTPATASSYMAEQLPNARLFTIEGAAHAPFLSHPQAFSHLLTDFLHE